MLAAGRPPSVNAIRAHRLPAQSADSRNHRLAAAKNSRLLWNRRPSPLRHGRRKSEMPRTKPLCAPEFRRQMVELV